MSNLLENLREEYGNRRQWVQRTRRRMLLHKISQNTLAKQMGVSRWQVNRWLADIERRAPSFNGRAGLLAMIRVDVALDEMIYGQPSHKEQG